ncbi:Tat pathway signal protein [Desulforhopalus sp. IMCC35007]|uniref:Tat pathway signal protein n=1 Tax=Desulforhopalus sp. IMCC35007 TaxID=2569543 RepID=UPI0010AE036F|nr:Tat pathway signal protein [Desulforhopalus sp. IMCC35007]TKB09431.1 Tat pathway signal protein [Desulforhopalus sp. IMCC35007]
MHEQRRSFLKVTLGAGVAGVGTLLAAQSGLAGDDVKPSASNGVVTGNSPKKEILYKKTQHWDIYYKSSY